MYARYPVEMDLCHTAVVGCHVETLISLVWIKEVSVGSPTVEKHTQVQL